MTARLLPGLLFLLPSLSLHAQGASDNARVLLRYAQFDPATEQVAIPDSLRASADSRVFLLQFEGRPSEAARAELRGLGVSFHSYMPENAYVVRMSAGRRDAVAALATVRSVTPYHPAFRIDPDLIPGIVAPVVGPERAVAPAKYNLVVVDKKADKPALMQRIVAIGGKVTHEQEGSILLEAELDGAQLRQAAGFDEVLWIDAWSPQEFDMDNARIQGGGNHVEAAPGNYTGQGVNGHVYEGVEATHRDFKTPMTNVLSNGAAADHGHCTAGIVFGQGASNPAGRGMAPDAKGFYTNNGSATTSRYQVVQALVNTHQVMFTTASWGNTRTRNYTSISADADDIIFDHDMAWTQSQSNAGNQDSRPQAWAKNIFSIGGVRHRNNSNPADDSWSGGGSTGPAADGRIKPDLCAYYDSILCSDRTGSAGYNTGGDFTTGFGGTSGATPIVAGHNALAIQMFTDGLFSPKRKANGTRFENRPHFTTLKALQIANARQYAFNASSTDNRREHCGWGFPDLKTMYDRRALHYVVDETDVLKQDEGMSYTLTVPSGSSELKIVMSYADPAANPSASRTRINDLTLRAISPTGKQYWGNVGLTQGNFSQQGGSRNVIDTVECVILQNPEPGAWRVDVAAYLVAQDSHVETSAVDADFGLVVQGASFVSKRSITVSPGAATPFGTSCVGSRVGDGVCMRLNESQGASGNSGFPGVRYMLALQAPNSFSLTGFELKMSSRRTGAITIPAYVYSATASGQPNQVLATGTMSVGASAQFWRASFAQPVAIASGQRFCIGFENANPTISVGTTSGGTTVPYWRNNGTNNSWVQFTTRPWAYRVLCPGTAIAPQHSAGAPTIGVANSYDLRDARGNAPVLLGMGFSRTQWGAVALPLDLAPFGAATCSLYASPDFLIPAATSAAGAASVVAPTPNDPTLVGKSFYTQYWVLDPSVNGLGLVFTNGVEFRIGD